MTASQLISAFAPNFTVLAGGRVLCALTHGLMWSVIAPIGARLVYVAGFQVGIMAGSLSGGLLYGHAGLALMLGTSTALVMVGLTCVTATRGLFEIPQATSRK